MSREIGQIVLLAVLAAGVVWAATEVIRALGFAIGTAIAISASGVAAAPWIAPTMAIGVFTVGGSSAYLILQRVVQQSKKDLFAGVLPALSIFTGAVVDIAKEFYDGSEIQKALYALIAGAFVLLAGILFERKGIKTRILAIAFALVPPALFALLVLQAHAGHITEQISAVPILAWVTFIILAITSIAVWFFPKSET